MVIGVEIMMKIEDMQMNMAIKNMVMANVVVEEGKKVESGLQCLIRLDRHTPLIQILDISLTQLVIFTMSLKVGFTMALSKAFITGMIQKLKMIVGL